MIDETCSVDGCAKRRQSRGLCPMHYRRFMLYGDTNYTMRDYGTGKKKHPLYAVYKDMVRRCSNRNDKAYHNYGGRGIKVCDRWLGKDGFWNFVDDMGKRPSGEMLSGRPRYTLDRIDVNGDYCKENCRWATWAEQGKNKRNNSTVFLWGERYTLRQACDIFGISPLSPSIVNKLGTTIEEAFARHLENNYGERVSL